jgi:uncharacterized protein YjbI with pentapeptide repeats
MSRKKDIQQLIEKHQRRLQKRKLQQAQYGLAAEPHILTEIEDIETEIAKLESELTTLDTITQLNPYRGLLVFREQDAGLFFGRETFTAHLVEQVQQKSLVALLGSSGSGKSSIVFAGVIPRLRCLGAEWLISSFRPGPDPFKGLAAGLLPLYETGLDKTDHMVRVPKVAAYLQEGELLVETIVATISETHPQAKHILLVADQFEELFTLTGDDERRLRFLNLLLAALAPTTGSGPAFHLFLTLRADFLGQALLYTPLRDALQVSLELLGLLAPDQLCAVVEQPAALRGVDFEPGLVDLIMADITNQPGSLPLLEFALTTLWEQQTHGALTHAAYRALGRVEGALSYHAERVFQTLSETEQTRAERLFLRLVQPGEATEDTRRLAYRHDLAEADWPLVQKLSDERLVVTNRDAEERETVEVAHEALIRGWDRLRAWIEADRAFLTWRKHLHFSLAQWQASQHDPGALLRGTLLQTAETWLADRSADLGPAERTFIEAGQALRQKEAAAEAQTRRQMLVLEIKAGRKDLKDADLSGTNLSGVNLSEANLHDADLRRANLRRANLRRANLREADLSEANLSWANLFETDLSKANLSKGDLSGVDLSGANLRQANLSEADLSVTNLIEANLIEADLSGANLSGARLFPANLSKANLIEADLSRANLNGTRLGEANLSEADLSEANLFRAYLRGANLSGADLSGANLRNATYDANTQWPINFDPQAAGASLKDKQQSNDSALA